EYRKDLLKALDKGLTDTYNLFNDPQVNSEQIVTLRALHAKLDNETLSAYGWDDLELTYEFIPEYEVEQGKNIPWKYRWPDELRDEVLARLLALNKERHQRETH